MSFRIGRRSASHSYPTPRVGFGNPSLLRIGSDLLVDDYAITAASPPNKVQKTAGTLLQIPLPGFRRTNGLLIQVTALMILAETGNSATISFFPWVKFASLAQYFGPVPPTIIAGAAGFLSPGGTNPLNEISVTLDALIKLPTQSSDGPPIALPNVDDLLVGISGQGDADFSFSQTTSVVASEVNAPAITQIPEVSLATLP